MTHILILILIGLAIGIVGTLIGAGGGFILVPILLLTQKDFSTETITAISMAVVAANAISGSIAYMHAKKVDYKAGALFALFTIPGSILGVYATQYISREAFDMTFGILLIILAAFLMLKGGKKIAQKGVIKKGWIQQTIIDKDGNSYHYSYDWRIGAGISSVVGFISPLLGIGGGIVHVPALTEWLRFPVHIATATSHFILGIMASVSVIVHLINGNYNDAIVQTMIFSLIIGVIPGAQIGAKLSKKIKGKFIIKSLALCLGIVGIRILFKYF